MKMFNMNIDRIRQKYENRFGRQTVYSLNVLDPLLDFYLFKIITPINFSTLFSEFTQILENYFVIFDIYPRQLLICSEARRYWLSIMQKFDEVIYGLPPTNELQKIKRHYRKMLREHF